MPNWPSNLSTSPGQAQIYPLCRPVVLRALRRSEGSNFHFFPWTHQSDKSLALLQKGAAEGAVMEAPCGNGVSVTTPLLTAVGEGGWEGMFPTVCNRESCQAFMARIWLSRPNQMDRSPLVVLPALRRRKRACGVLVQEPWALASCC